MTDWALMDDTVLRSRVMVAEEGEIFRKGHALLTPKELEGEYDGEELRIEVNSFFSILTTIRLTPPLAPGS